MMPEPLAAAFLSSTLPPSVQLTPGPFAFADAGRVQTILAEAGFGPVKISPFDAAIGGANLEQTLQLALNVGPLGPALRENPEPRKRLQTRSGTCCQNTLRRTAC